MNISAPFIARPVATILLTLGVALAGAASFNLLPVSPLPKIDVPAIFVSASLPGASPEVMAATVATPLERHLGAIADVDDMTSTSSVGSTNIQLTFGIDRDIDGAARDVQAAIEAAHADLPSALTRNPSYRKVNSSQFPILTIALTSDILTQGQIYDAADAVISQRLSQIDGVGVVNINGSALPAVRVEINPLALSKYGIGLQDVQAAISNANANAPKGAIEVKGLHYQIYTNDNARDASQYRDLIIASRNNAFVRIRDIAQVFDMQDGATQNRRTYGLYNDKAAITVQVFQQPGANIIQVVDAVLKELPELKADIEPKGPIDLEVISDRSVTIRGSLRQVEETLVIAVLMVILVVYIFLHSVRAALIPAVVVPVSLTGTFGVMYLAGYSLDNFSLMALTIATGFVVDDAIVVMENCTRHIENGVKPMQAALLGSREVGFTVVSMSLSLIAVFAPFQFIGGIIGRLFKEFTVSLSVAIMISLVISLTTTPMMCARLLGRDRDRKPGAFARAFNESFESMRVGYERTLGFALDHPRLMMLSLIATIGLNFYLYVAVPKGFFPQQDTGQLQGGIRGDAAASFGLIKAKLQQVAKILRSDPAVDSVAGSVGAGGFGGNASAQINVSLKPVSQRNVSADQVIARLRPKLNKIDGVIVFLQAVQDLGGGGGGRSANSEYQYTLLGDDLNELREWSQKLKQALQDVPEVTDVDTDLQPGGLETDLIVDRDNASRMGLNESIIDSALGNSFTQALVSTIYNPFSPQQYYVVMEVAPEFTQTPEVLNALSISTAGGTISGTQATQAVAGTTKFAGVAATSASAVASDAARNAASNSLANAGRGNTSTGSAISVAAESVVPYRAFSHYSTSTTPTSVNHTGTSISTSFSYNLPEGVALGTGLAAIEHTMARIHMPISIHGSAYGTAQLFQQQSNDTPLMLLAALVAIYVVLGILYESFTQPLTIISTLPSAGLGALLALLLTNTEFSLIAFLGILLLIGIVKKNAIMMVDFALEAERNLGLVPHDAIARACSMRFRPIMMTTFAAIAGALPLALSTGDGTELRRPLGISIVGGLIVSQLLTLYTTPVVYLYVRRIGAKRRARKAQQLRGTDRPDAGATAAI